MSSQNSIATEPLARDLAVTQRVAPDYEPPAVRRLGSLAELTRGGTVGPSDGAGDAGLNASI